MKPFPAQHEIAPEFDPRCEKTWGERRRERVFPLPIIFYVKRGGAVSLLPLLREFFFPAEQQKQIFLSFRFRF